jgi:hypothetical protein
MLNKMKALPIDGGKGMISIIMLTMMKNARKQSRVTKKLDGSATAQSACDATGEMNADCSAMKSSLLRLSVSKGADEKK